MNKTGILLALLSAVCWAFWSILGKLSVNHGAPPTLLAFASSCCSLVVVTAYYIAQRMPTGSSRHALLFAALSGVAGACGVLLFSVAIRLGNTALVVALSATYPSLTLLLSPLFLRESISLSQACGIALVTAGVVLLSR